MIQDPGLCCFFPCKCRQGPGATTAEACGAPGPGPAALRPPAPLAPADCCLSGGACRIGSPSPGLAETGGRWRGYDSFPRALEGERRRAQHRPESEVPARPRAARRARVWIPRDCAERLRSGRKLLLLRGCRHQVQEEKCNADRSCGAPHSPGRGWSAAEPLPFRRGG